MEYLTTSIRNYYALLDTKIILKTQDTQKDSLFCFQLLFSIKYWLSVINFIIINGKY